MRVELIPLREDNYTFAIIGDDETKVWLVDPSTPEVESYCKSHSLQVVGVLNTHHHIDHVEGNEICSTQWDCPIYASKYDENRVPSLTNTLSEGDTVSVFNTVFEVIETPGHTLGAITFICHEHKWVFTGDTLFSMGCGRLFEGTPEQMLRSLVKILSVGDDYQIFCGHEYTEANAQFALSLGEPTESQRQRIHKVRNLRCKKHATIPVSVLTEWETNPFVMHIQDRSKVTHADVQKFTELRQMKDNF